MKKSFFILISALLIIFTGCEAEIEPAENISKDEILSASEESNAESDGETELEERRFNDVSEILMYQIELYEKAYCGFPMDTDNEYSGIYKVAAAYMNDVDTYGRKVDINAEIRFICERWFEFDPVWENLRCSIDPLETVITVKEMEIGEESARILIAREFCGEELWDCEYVFTKMEADSAILSSEAEPLTLNGYYWKYESVTPITDEYTEEVIVITTAEELIEVCRRINAREPSYVNGRFVLGSNIDMTGYGWEPMGKAVDYAADIDNYLYAKVNTGFNGEFDGAGYTVYGINVFENSGGKCRGFFGTIGPFAYVHDLTVEGNILLDESGKVDNNSYAGGFSGVIYYGAKVENCHFRGNVKGNMNAGGFAGSIGYAPYATGEHYPGKTEVIGCSSEAEVTANYNCGGFAGDINGNIKDCDAIGNIYIVSQPYRPNIIGGFVGGLMSDIENCRSAVTIHYDVDAPDWMGNFIGEAVWEIKVKNCMVDTDNLHEGWRLIGMKHYKNCEIDIEKTDWHD